jgi:ribosomal protein S18 acetylase RimI-like enzyme
VQLRPFAVELAPVVAAWSTSAEESLMWCGHRDGLVSANTVAGWSTEDGVSAFGLHDGERLIAYGEIWVDDDAREVELARLIVDPDHRGRGVGRTLVTELTTQAQQRYPDVFMRVHPDNQAALRSYAAAGFVPVAAELAAEWNAPQPVAYVWLRSAP